MAEDKDASVLIIGAGIAGLSTGIAMRKYGIEPLVFEQAPDVDKVQVGAGVSLGYNVARAFRHIGILDDAMEVAVPIDHFQFVTHKGNGVWCYGFFQFDPTKGYPHPKGFPSTPRGP